MNLPKCKTMGTSDHQKIRIVCNVTADIMNKTAIEIEGSKRG